MQMFDEPVKHCLHCFFQVIPNDGISLFSIVRETGEVKLSKPLNYTSLSTYYRLKINASVSIIVQV